MPGCGARYSLTVQTSAGLVRRVSAQYVEDRDPAPDGRPGRVRSRKIVRCLVDGYPVLKSFSTLEEALGGPFVVLAHERDMEIQWFEPWRRIRGE